MIKIATRRNLIYPIQLLIWKIARDAEIIFIAKKFNFKNSLVYTSLMFFAEICTGLIVYTYQERSVRRIQKESNTIISHIELIQTDVYMLPVDKESKIILLIFIAALSDYVQFIIRSTVLPKYWKISPSLLNRLGGFITLFGTFFYLYALKIPISKHHKFSLILMSACLFVVVVSEFFFQEINVFLSHGDLLIVLLIALVNLIFDCLLDTIEKYLFEYNFSNPFKVLMLEGIFGSFLSLFLFLYPGYTEDVPRVYKKTSPLEFTLFIFLLIVFLVITGFKNIFKLYTTKVYSPMARAFTDYFVTPIYILYYYFFENDFDVEGSLKKGFYFGLNISLSLVISFCGLVFNEFLVLFCCGLERDTHDQISKRSNNMLELERITKTDDDLED